MQRHILCQALLAACLALSACELGLPGAGSATEAPVANAITGGEIEVTALDEPQAAPAGSSDLQLENAQPSADQPTPPDPGIEPVANPDVVEQPATVPKSDAQLACERMGGRWSSLGNAMTRTCVQPTRDAGKSCTRETQCESQCLARSGTCAPFKPLLGCNEVFQKDGARVTLCIE